MGCGLVVIVLVFQLEVALLLCCLNPLCQAPKLVSVNSSPYLLRVVKTASQEMEATIHYDSRP